MRLSIQGSGSLSGPLSIRGHENLETKLVAERNRSSEHNRVSNRVSTYYCTGCFSFVHNHPLSSSTRHFSFCKVRQEPLSPSVHSVSLQVLALSSDRQSSRSQLTDTANQHNRSSLTRAKKRSVPRWWFARAACSYSCRRRWAVGAHNAYP